MEENLKTKMMKKEKEDGACMRERREQEETGCKWEKKRKSKIKVGVSFAFRKSKMSIIIKVA